MGALRRCRLVRSALRAPERRTAITSSPSRERGGLHVTGITSSRRLQGARRRKDDSRGGQGASPSPSRPPALTLSCLPTTFHSVAKGFPRWPIDCCRSTLAVNICLPPCATSRLANGSQSRICASWHRHFPGVHSPPQLTLRSSPPDLLRRLQESSGMVKEGVCC